MWREAPEDVLFAADLPEAESIRVEVVDIPELVPHQLEELLEPGVVFEDVPDHEDAFGLGGQVNELFALFEGERERLLDEHVTALRQSALRERVVRFRGRGDGDGRAAPERVTEVGDG